MDLLRKENLISSRTAQKSKERDGRPVLAEFTRTFLQTPVFIVASTLEEDARSVMSSSTLPLANSSVHVPRQYTGEVAVIVPLLWNHSLRFVGSQRQWRSDSIDEDGE